nr:unnamed protein product [Callosobruchus analis]
MQCLKYVILFTVFNKTLTQECLSRDYGHGSIICVCNAEHCDTIDPVTPVEKSSYVIYTTNKAGLRLSKRDSKFATEKSEYENKVTVGEKVYQEILGFGGSFTDSTGINILSLNGSVQEKLLRSYFSDHGIEYNLCRVPIGGTDFSTRRYSYHDDVEDARLLNFKLQDEDHKYKIPLIQRAAAYQNALQLFASAWSAPKWMKVHSLPAGPFGYLKKKYYQTWADYHVKFLDAYAKENVTFWGMTTGNEPFTGLLSVLVPALGWTAERQLFENRAAEQYIDGIAVHWYVDRIVSSENLARTHEAFPLKFMISSEASLAGEFYKQPYYYVIGHFSKFVPRSSVRIEVTHSDKDLTVTAFRRPDNGTALVILNRTDKSKNVTVTTGDARKLHVDLTDRSLVTILYCSHQQKKYCDTIELEIPQPEGNNAVVYTSNKDGLRFQKKMHEFVSDEVDYDDQIIIGNQTYQSIIGFAWTAPRWMHTNGKFGGPVGFLKEEYYQQWADYHIKFLDAYAEQNVNFWGMTTGNEPLSGILQMPVPSVAWVAPTQREWVLHNLGPALRNSSHSKLKLMALDDQLFLLPFYMEIMFRSKQVEDYVDGIAVHWYEEGVAPSLSLSETHQKFPEKFLLATEASIGAMSRTKVCLGCWQRGEEYGGPTVTENFLDAPIIVNPEAGEFYKQPMYYAMGHFSKFVPPGSQRIETRCSSKDISVAGFKRPDGIIVVVILNK